MTITADMIKELRQRSGAGIMECKQALKEVDGDPEAALDFLRKKGASKAAKKAERSTREGAVSGAVSGASAALVEVKCETDFVARNEKFQELCKTLAAHVAAADLAADDAAFEGQRLAGGKTVKNLLTEKIHELGENITLGRREKFEKEGPGGFGLYIHGVGSIGALVEVGAASDDVAGGEVFTELCRDLAMQITASNPVAVDQNSLPGDVVAREREILEAQVRETGKPDSLVPKIVEGKLRKFYTEACLLEQPFIKDTEKNVKQHIEQTGKTLGAPVTVRRFCRFQLGE